MIEFIESAVAEHPELSLKKNKGENYRIMKTGWYGSLWIHKTETRGYCLTTTGTVGTGFNPQIERFLRKSYDQETVKGYKIWYVDTPGEVRKLIDIYGKI